MNFNLKSLNLKGNSRSALVKRNIVGSLLIKGISIIIQLMIVPLTLGYVSAELYGVWLTLSSIVLWLNFFDIGFTLGLKNKLAEALALNDWKKGRVLVSTTYVMMLAIFVPLALILFLIVPFVSWSSLLNVPDIYSDDIIRAIYILVACFCTQMIFNIVPTIISASQKVALSTVFPVIGNAMSMVVIYLLTCFAQPSLTLLAAAVSTMPIIVVGVASIILFSSTYKELTPKLTLFDSREVKNLFGLGAKFFLIQIQVVVLYQTTNILISNVSSPVEVTSYNIAYKYIGIAMMVFSIILQPLWPAFTDAFTKKDYNWMNNTYKRMTQLFLLSAFLICIMVLISPWAYTVWISDKADIPFTMTISVALYMVIHTWDSLQVQLINGIGAVKIQTYVTIIGLIAHVPMSLVLGNFFGAVGVVYSMTIINIIYATIFTIQMHKILNKKAEGIWIK